MVHKMQRMALATGPYQQQQQLKQQQQQQQASETQGAATAVPTTEAVPGDKLTSGFI